MRPDTAPPRTPLPPTSWFRITYAEAAAIGRLTPASLAAYYRTDALQLFAWAAEAPPQVPVSLPAVMDRSAYEWHVLCRDFQRGLGLYAGQDIAAMPYPEAAAVIAFYEAQVRMVSAAFAELEEDLRSPAERAAQPPGYWDRVADEIEFSELGIPAHEDPYEWLKKIPLWRYFSIRLLRHRISKAQRRAMPPA